MTYSVLAMQSWPEILADFEVNWFIYLSMPFIAAFVGWSTKIVAVEMLYRPMEFKGIGPFGWQGIVPRRAGKVGSKTIELLTQNLLKPEELLERVDAKEAVEALRVPLTEAIDEISREVAEQIRPGLWDSLPEAGRRAIQKRIEQETPRVVESLLNEMRADLPRFVDIQYLAVTTLVRNKDKLNKLMRSMGDDAMAFVRRSGIYFGLVIGVVQMFAWALFQNPWIMPAFGFGVGFISDYIALNMLFRPIEPKKYLGFITFQGLLHAQREKITRDYAKILADDLFSPRSCSTASCAGPARTNCSRWWARRSTPRSTRRPGSRPRWSNSPSAPSATTPSRTAWCDWWCSACPPHCWRRRTTPCRRSTWSTPSSTR